MTLINHRVCVPFMFMTYLNEDMSINEVCLPTFIDVVFYDERIEESRISNLMCPSTIAHLAVQDPFSNAIYLAR